MLPSWKAGLSGSTPTRAQPGRSARQIVLLDFWTYCCINCLHVIHELQRLEADFPNELVVIGVHSAKFPNEGESENIRQAILRYDIEHRWSTTGSFRSGDATVRRPGPRWC